MYEPIQCFKCGEWGHPRAECPKRRTPAAKAPVPAAPSGEGAGEREKAPASAPVPLRRAPEEIADSHAWANAIRVTDPRMGRPHCGDDADITTSEFRRVSRLGAAHSCRLRIIAAEQLAESRQAGERTETA